MPDVTPGLNAASAMVDRLDPPYGPTAQAHARWKGTVTAYWRAVSERRILTVAPGRTFVRALLSEARRATAER